jgi:hypothetical protein
VVRRRVASDAKFEAIPVAVEVIETPSIEPVSLGVDFFHRHRGAEHEEIEPIVDVVLRAGVAKTVPFTGAFFAGETIGGLAVLARVAVAVGVEVEHGVV